jgi:DNA-binding NarL/FixJ family response regulator
VVVASAQSDGRTVREALAARASGYVLKERAVEELPAAVRTAADGQVYVSPQISAAAS